MGVAAMTLSGGEYTIHGTNEPSSIGRFVPVPYPHVQRRHAGPLSPCGRRNAFGAQDHIYLPSIAFGAPSTLGYTENSNNTGCTLTISDGAHAASIALLGNYIAASFVTAADGHCGTLISEAAQVPQQPLLAKPHA